MNVFGEGSSYDSPPSGSVRWRLIKWSPSCPASSAPPMTEAMSVPLPIPSASSTARATRGRTPSFTTSRSTTTSMSWIL